MKHPKDVRDELGIDKTQLDHELMAQPMLTYDVASKSARAVSFRDSCKDQLKLLEAQIGAEVRESMAKPSVAAVDCAVESDMRMVEGREAYAKACATARDWEASYEAVRARGFALHKLVDFELAHGAALMGQHESAGRKERREGADTTVQAARKTRRAKREIG